MKRIVTGTIHHPDERPWKYAKIVFSLQPGSFSSRSQTNYPEDKVLVRTDEEGKFSVGLWTNVEGETPTQYTCTLPNDKTFNFTLDFGSPIDLVDLRATAQEPTEWRSPTVRDYVEQLIQEEYEQLAIALNQTIFSLAKAPTAPHLSKFYVNGVKAIYVTDYTINGVILTIPEPFPTDWELEIYYK